MKLNAKKQKVPDLATSTIIVIYLIISTVIIIHVIIMLRDDFLCVVYVYIDIRGPGSC